MADGHNRRPSQWRRLFAIAYDLIDQVRERTDGYDFQWSLGGGTAMMIQIGHRESHDVDIFVDDPQLLGFLDPAKSDLHFTEKPADYLGDGARFQKFSFEGIGEIDFIAAGSLTSAPFEVRGVEGRPIKLETIPEIIVKKVCHRDRDATPRDIFDIAAAERNHRAEVIAALRAFPDHVARTLERLDKLNPEFVAGTISQLMILPGYANVTNDSLNINQNSPCRGFVGADD